MGYRSNVRIKISKKGFEMVEENIKKSKYTDMLNFDVKEELSDGAVLFGYDCVKWYFNFNDVQTVESILRKLDTMVEENPEALEEYFYKEIQIGEDGAITEYSNDEDEEFVEDFYVCTSFSL